MNSFVKQRVMQILSQADAATLSTVGPAGLLAGNVACEAWDGKLYLMLPQTSDHLVNLEASSEVVASSTAWIVYGLAGLIEREKLPPGLKLLENPDAPWTAWLEVVPRRVQLVRPGNWAFLETYDLDY
jgi:hypothetical protein